MPFSNLLLPCVLFSYHCKLIRAKSWSLRSLDEDHHVLQTLVMPKCTSRLAGQDLVTPLSKEGKSDLHPGPSSANQREKMEDMCWAGYYYNEVEVCAILLSPSKSCLVNTFLCREETLRGSDFRLEEKVIFELADLWKEKEAEIHIHSPVCTWWRTQCRNED